MKAEIIKKEKSFTPVTIQITFESKNELLNLFARLNTPFYLTESAGKAGYEMTHDASPTLFNLINSLIDNQ